LVALPVHLEPVHEAAPNFLLVVANGEELLSICGALRLNVDSFFGRRM